MTVECASKTSAHDRGKCTGLRAVRKHTAPHPSHEETCKSRRPLDTSFVMTGMSLQADGEYSDKPDRNPRSDVHDDAVTVSVSP